MQKSDNHPTIHICRKKKTSKLRIKRNFFKQIKVFKKNLQLAPHFTK